MFQNFDISLVDWSRGQFALTALYHWLFVPLTLGLSVIVAIMETIYVKTGNKAWKKITKFWMTIFGINFAIGVATGIILEFEFGTNWSKYSWFVGDIFGAPLAIEGILAFFMESTFIAVMFFGWEKVSKKFHLASTWLTALGSNLSALWILIANAWMQNPTGMHFNPDTARNEMVNFFDVALSPTAINKFLHTVSQAYVLASLVVLAISAWFLLKNRDILFAKRSIVVGSVFGLIGILLTIYTGDGSAQQVFKTQPMKFASMEALYEGQDHAPLIAFGITGSLDENNPGKYSFPVRIEVPGMLSYLSSHDANTFVPGIKDLINGNKEHNILSLAEKEERGYVAIMTLKEMKEARDTDPGKYKELRAKFEDPQWIKDYFAYFGYGYYKGENPAKLLPNIVMTFYSFHLMVLLGFFFLLVLLLALIWGVKDRIAGKKWFLWVLVWTAPLAYVATELGWITAEVGRQPWVVQDLMPNVTAVSNISAITVQVTFWLFTLTFTILAIAEIKIMFKQIKLGPKDGGQ
ncbi:MAG: cytochrome ubiquinol oxidase subunit I [Bacteroidales bacterium]|nr:cytochrome ubiquinol oxidase subunit I [Bacteroidales bacterium]